MDAPEVGVVWSQSRFSVEKACSGSSSCGSLDWSGSNSEQDERLSLDSLSDPGVFRSSSRQSGSGDQQQREIEDGEPQRRPTKRVVRQRELTVDNQLDKTDARKSSSCNSLDLELDEKKSDRDGDRDALSLPLSTDSEAAPYEIEPSSSDSDGATAKAQVLLSDDDSLSDIDTAVGPLAHEMSSFFDGMSDNVDVFQLSEAVVRDGSEFAANVGDDDDYARWKEFDAALPLCDVATARDGGSPMELIVPAAVDLPSSETDDGYDGSASEAESLSSMNNVIGNPTPQLSMRPELHDGLDAAVRSDNESSLSLGSSALDRWSSSSSSRSPPSTACCSVELDHSEQHAEPSSGDEEEFDQSRWIENVPILRDSLPNPAELESVYAAPHPMKRPPNVNSIRLEDEDIESLSDYDELESPTKLRVRNSETLLRIAYDELDHREWYVPYTDVAGIVDRYVARRDGVFLDLGCGTSRFCEELVCHGRRNVFGIDSSFGAIAYQRRQPAAVDLLEYLHFLPMDATKSLLFPDQFCDLIFSKATLDEIAARGIRDEHPQDLLEMLRECIRCLKHGGVLMAVVHQENLLDWGNDTAASMTDSLSTPWWQWAKVKHLLNGALILHCQFEVGQPRMVDGVKTKPYKVLVWRRRESALQRLRRAARDLLDRQQQSSEYETRLWWQQRALAQREQEQLMVREMRQMILEDEQARQLRSNEGELVERQLRFQRRKAFYAGLVEAERRQAEWEDAQGQAQHDHMRQTRTLVVQTIAELIDSVVGISTIRRQEAETLRHQTAAEKAAEVSTAANPSPSPLETSQACGTTAVRRESRPIEIAQPGGTKTSPEQHECGDPAAETLEWILFNALNFLPAQHGATQDEAIVTSTGVTTEDDIRSNTKTSMMEEAHEASSTIEMETHDASSAIEMAISASLSGACANQSRQLVKVDSASLKAESDGVRIPANRVPLQLSPALVTETTARDRKDVDTAFVACREALEILVSRVIAELRMLD